MASPQMGRGHVAPRRRGRMVHFSKVVQVSQPLDSEEWRDVTSWMTHLSYCRACQPDLLYSFHPSQPVDPLCVIGQEYAEMIANWAYIEDQRIFTKRHQHRGIFPICLEIPPSIESVMKVLLKAIARGYRPSRPRGRYGRKLPRSSESRGLGWRKTIIQRLNDTIIITI